ncbi:MAG: hypothetical protein O9289_16330 [Rhodobacteraceae bacterium]|jgi:hypothetical protein|nr:hypothetical protein [Paracoccaceae bacterium]MCZ8084766.1 hypothetical protein [Paracoccaceae bacterium]
MKRLAPLAVILSILAGPSFAGGFSFDLPVLTWPSDGATILGTKSATKP